MGVVYCGLLVYAGHPPRGLAETPHLRAVFMEEEGRTLYPPVFSSRRRELTSRGTDFPELALCVKSALLGGHGRARSFVGPGKLEQRVQSPGAPVAEGQALGWPCLEARRGTGAGEGPADIGGRVVNKRGPVTILLTNFKENILVFQSE